MEMEIFPARAEENIEAVAMPALAPFRIAKAAQVASRAR